MSVNSRDIESIVAPIVVAERLILMNVKVSGSPRKPFIQIFVDDEEHPVTINQCAGLSCLVQDVLDIQDQLPKTYSLEVSSPGVDFPLSYLWQFKRNVNRSIKLINNGETVVQGRIVSVSEDGDISLSDDSDKITIYPLADLVGARVSLEMTGHRAKVNRKTNEKRNS